MSYTTMKLSTLTARGIKTDLVNELVRILPAGAFLAGGMFESLIRGKEPKDIDVFFTGAEALESTLKVLTHTFFDGEDTEPLTPWRLVNDMSDLDKDSVRFLTLKREGSPDIQLIKMAYFLDVRSCIDTFDFTAAQIGLDNTGFLTMNAAAMLDIARMRLVLHKMTYPASTLRRMLKYANKGYYVCPGSLQIIAESIPAALAANPNGNGIVYLD